MTRARARPTRSRPANRQNSRTSALAICTISIGSAISAPFATEIAQPPTVIASFSATMASSSTAAPRLLRRRHRPRPAEGRRARRHNARRATPVWRRRGAPRPASVFLAASIAALVGSRRQRRRIGHRGAQVGVVPRLDAPRRQTAFGKARESGGPARRRRQGLPARRTAGRASPQPSIAGRNGRSSSPHAAASE